MTCQDFVLFVRGPVRASWLVADIPPGPRSPRTRSFRAEACGLAKTTGPNLTPVGLTATEMRQAFTEQHLQARRMALIGTLHHLRRQHKPTCSVMDDLQSVTLALLSQGDR